MELWNDIVTDKSRELLLNLKGMAKFVLIGGWAVWLYTQAVKSKDIDIYINFDDFFKLQELLIEKGIPINLNSKLNKYEGKMEEIDIDIYTPHHCNLIISCKEVFDNKFFKDLNGFSVVIPEALLILKLDAEEERHNTIKGFKDRIDILSLLHKAKLDKKILNHLAGQHSTDLTGLKKIITSSRKEYSYFFEEAENLKKLKELKKELAAGIKI